MKKVSTLIVAVSAAVATLWTGFTLAVGHPPFASKSEVEPLVEWVSDNISAQQIPIQFEIERLKEKCRIKCTDYDRRALENFQDKWRRNQDSLDRFKRQRQEPK